MAEISNYSNYSANSIEYSFDVSIAHWNAWHFGKVMQTFNSDTRSSQSDRFGLKSEERYVCHSDMYETLTELIFYPSHKTAAYANCTLKVGQLSIEIPKTVGPSKAERIVMFSWQLAEWETLVRKQAVHGLLHFTFKASKLVPKNGFSPLAGDADSFEEAKIIPKDFTVLFDGELFEKEADTDFCLKCESSKLFCHKMVLCKRSPVFERVINGDGAEARTGFAELSSNKPEDVKLLLEVVYGKTRVEEVTDRQQLLDLFTLLHLYRIEPELHFCASVIASRVQIDTENVALLTKIALIYNMAALKQKCVEALSKMPESTIYTEEWKELFDADPKPGMEFYKELLAATMLQ